MIRFTSGPTALCALFAAGLIAGPVQASDAAHPAVVELFQSQGCSSCPPANANLLSLVERPDILALSFEVTYWDHLGWKDTFDDPAYTQRQKAYAPHLGHGEIFTPQVVVNGRADVVGARPGEIEALVAKADRGRGGPDIRIDPSKVFIGDGPPAAAAVWLVRFDPRLQEVAVRAGENSGRTLPHRNVVRALIRLGVWGGAAKSFPLPANLDKNLLTAVLVQSGDGGPILAAARAPQGAGSGGVTPRSQ